MTSRGRRAALVLLAVLAAIGVRPMAADEEQLWAHRNLGKAFYENPTTQYQAVEEFAKALALAPGSARERLNYGLALLRAGKTDGGIAELERVQRQDPIVPHTWFNLGIQYKKRGTSEATALAIAQFEKMIALVPDEPISHYNLGSLYKASGRAADALRHFETAARLAPHLAGPHFQLYNAYRDPGVGRIDDANRELAIFRTLKKQQEGAVIPEDLEWSFFSEIWDPIDPADREPSPAPVAPSFDESKLLDGLDAATAGLALLAADGDERPDVVAWSSRGMRLIAGGDTPIDSAGVEHLRDVASVAPGDFDNDGTLDLAVVTHTGVSLRRGTGQRSFTPRPAALPQGSFTRAFWFDHDHDYDLDLLLLGARSYLLRNAGEAGFVDATTEFPFVEGRAIDVTPFEVVADTIGFDLVVSYADRPGVLYRDRLAGRYEAVPLDVLPSGARALRTLDFNHDSWMDIAGEGTAGPFVLLNGHGRLAPLPLGARQGGGLAVADFLNTGVVDLIAGDRLLRWTPDGVRDAALGPPAVARLAADFNGDGRTDLLDVDASGAVRLRANTSASSGRWVRVALEGVKNLKVAPGAEVEVKAGSRYQKALYAGVPILFGLGAHESIDTIRITWPNGLIQNEPRQPVGRSARFKEAPRLSGSCPMVFTWDGTKFRFITDVLGVAPLGASAGDGEYFAVDRDEDVHIPGEALAPVDGHYEIRVTEELREVAYIDRLQLVALDYPAGVTIVTNDKFKAPPFPDFRLFGVERAIPPQAARDHRGADVLERLLRADRRYVNGFQRDFEGVAERHYLDLDFGSAASDTRAVLILTGWVDWADGSTFRRLAQERSGGLAAPSLQVKDGRGEWQTVIEDMGLPAGKTKTIAVDLTGKFLSASREVRIVTTVCVYWDQIYLSTHTAPPEVRLTPLDMASAELAFHGFSKLIADPARMQPEEFDYHQVQPVSMWNPTPGLYTRFGDVMPLLRTADDQLVVMGSGDEIRVRFHMRRLPPLAAGWRRDFLLRVEGYAKDGDANTAFSQSVEPLPFRAMTDYPYGSDERFPRADDARRYNTRPALRFLRSLVEGREPR
ncbi:MAG: hypothetical protein HYU37_09680 [Acidobacteria bacterium]|nr:hypothetical protein [Acidobacteriota bacterium]